MSDFEELYLRYKNQQICYRSQKSDNIKLLSTNLEINLSFQICRMVELTSTQVKSKSWTHFFSELTAALIAGFMVSPTNAILDKSVIEYANGKATLQGGVKAGFTKLFKHPLEFVTSFKFRWMFFVYGMTYTSSNYADHINISDNIPHAIQKLLIVFGVNTTCGILKDKAYVQKFGTYAVPKPFPISSLLLLFTRDIITVAAAFTWPPILGKVFASATGMSERQGTAVVQLLSPLLIQIVATPLHLLGLDLYNREGVSLANRFQYIKGLYAYTLGMRMIRFLPAYGIGGVVNTQIRRYFKQPIIDDNILIAQ